MLQYKRDDGPWGFQRVRVVPHLGLMDNLDGATQRSVPLLKDRCVLVYWNDDVRITHNVQQRHLGFSKWLQPVNRIASVCDSLVFG